MTTDEMRALAEQCISHPASRTTGDIMRAGMAIIELLARDENSCQTILADWRRDLIDLAACLEDEAKAREALQKDQQKALQELADDAQLVYSAWSR